MYSRVRRPRAEGRHDGLAAARGEARQKPRRRRREDADPGPHSKHRPPPGKVLAVHESRAAAGLFRQVVFFRGRAHVEGAPLVRRGSGSGLVCGGGGFRSSGRLCRGGGGHRGIGRRRLSGGCLVGPQHFLDISRAAI